jgi:hypothetical protein
MEIVEQYRGLSRKKLLELGYQKGHDYLINSSSCAPSTVAALHDILGFDPVLVKASTSFSGGTASQYLGTCGVLSGGILVLGYYIGRPLNKMSDKMRLQDNIEALRLPNKVAQKLADKFIQEYGTFICAHLHRKMIGRIFCLTDELEEEKFKNLGGSQVAADIVGKGVGWVIEIMIDNGIIET